MSKKKILINAGGGVFGFTQALFYNSIFIDDIRNYVDIISGCSIGGINSLILAEGKSSEDLMDFYLEFTRKIFDKNKREGVVFKEYSAQIIEDILKKSLTKKFGELDFPCIIPYCDFLNDELRNFENISGTSKYLDWYNWEIGRVTSAAPTYFDPYGRKEDEIFLDGGVYEVAPVMDTVTTVKKTMGIEFSDMDVLMMGTGVLPKTTKTLKEVKNYTPIDWLRYLLVPYVTMANEITSIEWATKIGLNSFEYFNPVQITGSLDDADQVTDGTLYKITEPHFDEFKKVFLNFVRN